MKKLTVCIASGFYFLLVHAQNVGVNITSPQASLDVRGSQRVGGINNYIHYDSSTGRIQWIGSALFTPFSQQVIRHSASGEGLYAGGGRLEYRNTTDPVFFSDWTTGNGYFRNRLGINNLNPQFPLSFDGSLGDKISLWTDGTSTHYGFGIQGSLLQIFSKTSVDDIAFGYGSSSAFTERMRIKGNGNVGIGTLTPFSPLTFNNNLGEKISLYGTATNNYGFGVQGGTLQIHSDAAAADIAFGHGSSGSFTERMRIKGNGNVGIGNTNPQFPLEINGRMRLWGTNPNDPGIWLNDAGVDRGFLGLQNNNHIGFYGSTIGWGFTMNTTTGAIALNGNEGTSGQVMQTTGAAGAAQWQSIANVLPSYYIYNNVLGATYTDVNAPGEFAIANSTVTFSVPGDSRLMVSANYTQYGWCSVGPCVASGRFYFKVDGGSTENQSVMSQAGGGYASVSLSNFFYDVAPGSHTITFYTRPNGGSARYWAYLGSATIIVMQK